MDKKYIIILFSMLCCITIIAQQNPQYTQYMYNMRIVNPGYMVNEPSVIEAGLLYRKQWVGIQNSPSTANAFASIPLTRKLEGGISFINDRLGSKKKFSSNTFNADMVYKVNLSETMNLSFGLKAGVNSIRLDMSETNVADDPLFQNTSSKMLLNIGAGLFLFGDNYYAGLSAPNIVASSDKIANSNVYTNRTHLYVIGGYIFDLSSDVRLKPSLVLKYLNGIPLSYDLSLNTLLYHKVELGIAYRNQDAVSGLITLHATPNLRVGYAYDFNIGELKDFNSGSHEFIVLYKFDFLKLRKQYKSPRFY